MSKSSARWLSWVPLVLWLLGSAGLVTWAVGRSFHVGQMLLPREQAAAIAVAIALCAGLALSWVWLLLRALARRLGAAPAPSLFERRIVRYPLLALLLLLPLLLLYGRYVEPRWVVVRTVELGSTLRSGAREGVGPEAPPRAGAAATNGPVRVAVISDLHMDGDREPFTSLADHVNGTDPDLILLLGDTLNSPRGLKTLRRSLGRMRARHGKYAVRGNWEVWYWRHLSVLKGTGFSWLSGRQVTRTIRGTTVHLTGLDYSDRLGADRVRRVMRRLEAARPAGWRLFLYHTPDLVEQVSSAQLYLAGHTHGGQISVPLFGALVTLSRYGKRYERGLTALGWRRWIYVNPGVGVEPMVPLRIGVRPEVTLFELGQPPQRPVEAASGSGGR
jgi:uncharacterized protein